MLGRSEDPNDASCPALVPVRVLSRWRGRRCRRRRRGEPAVPGQFVLEPAGDLIRTAEGAVAEGSLPLAFVRSPDDTGPDHGGRYLIAVNSGYGIQLHAKSNEGQQLLQVIDLAAQPSPVVVQSVYFPTPQSVNVGVAFGRKADTSGAWPLYASGGVQDRVWLFTFTPGASAPLSPANDPATL